MTNPLRKFSGILCVAGIALATAMPAAAASDEEGFADAMALYRDGRYSTAYGHFAKLADGGHADAARIALLMVRFGPQLYGVLWSASAYQVARWADFASASQAPLVADSGE